MVRSPARSKESKWSHLRRRPRYIKPTHRSFTVTWQDSTPNSTQDGKGSSCNVSSAEAVPTGNPVNDPHGNLLAQSKPDLLDKSPSFELDTVPPSYSTSPDREVVVDEHTLEVVRSGYESELEEDPVPHSVPKLRLLPSSAKALSELLPNFQPSKSIGLLKHLCIDSHPLIIECTREPQLVKKPLLNIIAERQPSKSENLTANGMSSSFGKERSRKKLDFQADTNGVAVSTFWRQHGTFSTSKSANLHGKEERSAEKESKSRHSKMHHVEVSKGSTPENQEVASVKKHMSDVASMSKGQRTTVAKIQNEEKSVHACEMESQKHNLFGNRLVVAARKCTLDLAAFRPKSHSTPIVPMRHITLNADPSIPMELGPVLPRILKRTALKLEAQPVSSDIIHAAKNAPHMSSISPCTPAQYQQHSRATSHSLTKQRQHITCPDNIAYGGADKSNESSIGKAGKVILVEQQDVCIPRHQDCDSAKQLCLPKHNRSQDCAEDMQASEKRLARLHVSFFDGQSRHLGRSVINNDMQSEAGSPVIPKLQESGRTRKGKMDACSESEHQVLELKLLKSGQTKSSRDAQCGTESPIILKLQESAQAKKPRMDKHDLPESSAIAKLQERAQRKKRKKAKVWVRVQLYDQPNGRRSKADVNMYDIYLTLALEIIEENSSATSSICLSLAKCMHMFPRCCLCFFFSCSFTLYKAASHLTATLSLLERQKCQSDKEKTVMKWFYEEVAKDATAIIDDVQLYTNELFELEKEVQRMNALSEQLYNIGLEVQKYVKENSIQGVDPFQFYFEGEHYE
ncbi:uncharacterized protein LOC142585676 isoform X2 [Dermacentor variabilis]|uniref:uncharacterized protein LOC142585676 isoform X2 n=1 Tax=Dermacentor variabilis TaxID=34621 RepID=UPI003F5B1555